MIILLYDLPAGGTLRLPFEISFGVSIYERGKDLKKKFADCFPSGPFILSLPLRYKKKTFVWFIKNIPNN